MTYSLRSSLLFLGAAVIVVVVVVWFDGRDRGSSPTGDAAGSAKMVGKSALSHGPARGSDSTTGSHPSTPFLVGQTVIVDQPVVVSPAASPKPRALPIGTEVVISAMAENSPNGSRETRYEITASDGTTGWVPERALRRPYSRGGTP
jgi:hypothetical protein